MDSIREYLIGVVAAALLCGVVTSFLGKKGMLGAVIKLLAGLLMVLAVVRPWVSISLDGWFDWTENVMADGQEFVLYGEAVASDAYRAGIKQQLEAYIEDEAKALECTITAEITLTDESIPAPQCVTLYGNISPYARRVLSDILTEDLGIKQEDQIWNASQ